MFGQSYVCRACRLRLSTALRSKRGRQPFSHSAAQKQDSIEDVFSTRRPNQARHGSRTYSDQDSGTEETVRRGRYSGRVLQEKHSLDPLQPKQLLERLDEPGPPRGDRQQRQFRRTDERRAPQNDRHQRQFQRRDETRPPQDGRSQRQTPSTQMEHGEQRREDDSSSDAVYLRSDFMKAFQSDDGSRSNIWPLLQRVILDMRSGELVASAKQDKEFFSACHEWSDRVCDAWVQRLPVMLSQKSHQETVQQSSGPDPLQAILACTVFGFSFKAKAFKVLWLTARELSEKFAMAGRREPSLSSSEKQVIRQLMALWSVIMAKKFQSREARLTSLPQSLARKILDPSLAVDWSFLPPATTLLEMLPQGELDHMEAITVLTGTMPRRPHDEISETASPALLTLDLLQTIKLRSDNESFALEHEPWMELVTTITQQAKSGDVPHLVAERMRTVSAPSLQMFYQEVAKRWSFSGAVVKEEPSPPSDVPPEAAREIVVEQPTNGEQKADIEQNVPAENVDEVSSAAANDLPESTAPDNSASFTDRFVYANINRLRRAGQDHDVRMATRVRENIIAFGRDHPELTLPIQMYDHLIQTFLVLRNFQTAMECWNLLVESGHRPTAKTYTIAMRYSQFLKGANPVQFFWEKMRRERIQPDVYVWTARIGNLARRGKPDLAMRAMIEMGQEWFVAARTVYAREHPTPKHKGAAKSKSAQSASDQELLTRYEGDVDGVPRPTIYTLNNAIGGLCSLGSDATLIPKALAWGRLFGIEPDIITYNSLLRLSVQQEMRGEALDILGRMKERNIQTDSETWTLLLGALFRNKSLEGLDPQAQEDRVMAFIEGLEDASTATIDQKGYALVLDRMLKHYDNPQAAQRVLSHMASKGVEPTVYHYTILMTAYFQQSPPDLPAIQSLWNRIEGAQSGYGRSLGSIFYDRMIEGYATYHKMVGTAPMLSFLQRMEHEGKVASWRALETVVQALAEAGEWEQLSQIVDRTRRRLREAGVGGTTHRQHEFWQLVIDTGILKHEGITDPNQIMVENRGGPTTERLQMLR